MGDAKKFHCKCSSRVVKMPTRILQNLDLYPIVDQRQMKVIDANYRVRVGYSALRNNVKKYKFYATMIWMFDLIFMNNLQQVPNNNPWPVEPTNHNYKIRLLQQIEYLLGMNGVEQYSLVEASCKKWLKNGNDLDDDEYELSI
jgi:hypothetical protein